MKRILIALVLLNIVFLAAGLKVAQENPIKLFLSDETKKEFYQFQKEFEEQDLVFVSHVSSEKLIKILDQVESQGGEFASLSPLLPNAGILNVPKINDSSKFQFFEILEKKFPELRFAGEGYTNAHLAGMSIKIQKVLFPIVFVLILLGLVLLTRNFAVSSYLFLTSLLGVGIGLTVIHIFYKNSTILTSLTPLICFVLTLGVQLHVVYGISFYKEQKKFFQKKLSPLLIMMITTLIGFFSLITSDLEAIRQLAITSTIALGLTWAILLGLIKVFPFTLNLNQPSFVMKKLKTPPYRPMLGWSLLILLTLGGSLGLIKMPVVVEAIKFFAPDHLVQQGFMEVKKEMGGTPQFEIIITRKDRKEMAFEDYQKILIFESALEKNFPPVKFISMNNLIRQANSKYIGEDSLPDNIYAYQALQSKLPPMLAKNQLGPAAYRISYISEILKTDVRKTTEETLKKTFSLLSQDYNVRISGLTYLLLKSQARLVDSLVRSFFISFLVIVILFSMFSRNIKEIFIFATLNFASILGGIFFMWLTGMNLNVSSVMTVSISMGLVVDSTVHLLYAKKEVSSRDELKMTTYTPIIFSHILLFFAFLALAPENFVPIRDFSLGLVILLFVGLLCDLFALPLIDKND